jgi:hypothetical protein
MPTFSKDISDKYLNLFDEFIHDSSVQSPLNPGQVYALENMEVDLEAIITIEIAGPKIDAEVSFKAAYRYEDYISETVDILQETFEAYTQQIANLKGFDAESLIDEAFRSL